MEQHSIASKERGWKAAPRQRILATAILLLFLATPAPAYAQEEGDVGTFVVVDTWEQHSSTLSYSNNASAGAAFGASVGDAGVETDESTIEVAAGCEVSTDDLGAFDWVVYSDDGMPHPDVPAADQLVLTEAQYDCLFPSVQALDAGVTPPAFVLNDPEANLTAEELADVATRLDPDPLDLPFTLDGRELSFHGPRAYGGGDWNVRVLLPGDDLEPESPLPEGNVGATVEVGGDVAELVVDTYETLGVVNSQDEIHISILAPATWGCDPWKCYRWKGDDRCHKSEMRSATQTLERTFNKPGHDLDVRFWCFINYPGPDWDPCDAISGGSNCARKSGWVVDRLEHFVTENSLTSIRNLVDGTHEFVVSWLNMLDHNGEAFSTPSQFAVFAEDTTWRYNLPNKPLIIHEIGHMWDAVHHPSGSWKDVNTCYHTENGQRVYHRSVMNYCYAAYGYTRFDSANWSRVYNHLWT